ncbi:MAG: winged helix-turn-helix domain-containing protein [Acidobacteriota bacterium]
MEEDLFPVSSLDSFRVGDFLIRPKLKAVRPFHGFDAPSSAEKDHRLPDKAIAVLLKLAEQPRRVVRREQLLDDVWGQEREAYDRVLDNAISELRRAFGDNARKPRYIQTITKQGYRLIAPVEWPERYGGPDGETSVGPELEDEVVTTAPGLGDPAGSTASAGQTVGNERAEAPGPTVRRGRAGDTPGAGGEPGSDAEAPPGGGAADDDSALTMRLFRPLFIALGVLLAVALAFALERDGKLRVFVAGFENGSGDARFDDIEAQVRGHLAELACPGAPLALRRFGWTTNTSIVGRVEERQGRLVMAATITGPGVSERVEREFTPGLEASRVILAFSDRVQRSLDEQLCTAASPGDAGAACPCLRMVEARLAEGDVSAIEGPLALVLAAEPSVEALEIAIAARDARGGIRARAGTSGDARNLGQNRLGKVPAGPVEGEADRRLSRRAGGPRSFAPRRTPEFAVALGPRPARLRPWPVLCR